MTTTPEQVIAAPHEFTQAVICRLELACPRYRAELHQIAIRHTSIVRAAEAAGKAIPAEVLAEKARDARSTANLDCF